MDTLLNVGKGETPLLPMATQEKYISMFQIDGEPILPPLMTTEKRYEMQMYREKAIQLERKFQGKRVQFDDAALVEESPRSPLDCSYSDNTSQHSSDERQSETENDKSCTTQSSADVSPKILVNNACNTDKYEEQLKLRNDCGTNTANIAGEKSLKQRVSELSKSETVMFDLVAQTILTSANIEKLNEEKLKRQEKQSAAKKAARINAEEIREMIEKANLTQTKPIKSMHLPLQKRSAPNISIPAICVNPPTPVVGTTNICDSILSCTESVVSSIASGFQSSQAEQLQATKITEDSADDSCNTHSTEHIGLVTPQKKITNITARILKFEHGLQNTTQQASPEDEQYLASRPPQRSATSPSLKSLIETMNSSSLTTSPRNADTSATSLVRSSSFTLDAPSKALIEHMQKQYEQSIQKTNTAATMRPNSGPCSISKSHATPSPSAWRDTVESKAKRVQKKLEFKPSSRQASATRSKSKASTFNNYPNSTAHIWNNPIQPLKVKKSPYDVKGAPTSQTKSAHGKSKHQIGSSAKPPKSHAIKKTVSSTTYTVRPNTTRKTVLNNNQTSPNTSDVMSEIENRHRQKLNALIAQQREEERRLQQIFNAQREILINQLSNEMHQINIDGGQKTPTLQIDGVSIGIPLTPAAVFNGNSHKAYTSTTTATLDRTSPTLSITSSYLPSFGSAIAGFTATTTLAPCEVVNVEEASTASSTITESSTRRAQQFVKNITSRATAENFAHDFDSTTQLSPTLNNLNSSKKRSNETEMERRHSAATIINACARGFLVRRLFQTEQIQRIVQTIRDTLIFVLNLHMETMENVEEANTEANIKLKARLLQQLASASRTLHLIFFQTSVKERMEIISRDRKRIKTKLLSMSLKRSPRIA